MKKALLGLILTLLLSVGFNQKSMASHIAGGTFTYQCLGNDSFLVSLILFRNCDGISLGTTAFVTFSCPGQPNITASLNLTTTTGVDTSQLCATATSQCAGGAFTGIEAWLYEGIVVLPPCASWTMTWTSCCKPTGVVNLNNSSSANTDITSTLNNLVDSCNNSPIFTNIPIPYVCAGQSVDYNFGIVEPDGDSLAFSFTSPQGAGITFAPGFSAPVPIPGITIDPNTGQIQFTAPTTLGTYVVTVQIDEYDPNTGILIGSTIREIQFVVESCSNQVPFGGGFLSVSDSNLVIDSNSLLMCYGASVTFDVVFNDLDTGDILTASSNILSILPTATISYSGTNPLTATVSWTAGPQSVPFSIFTINVEDDNCPVPGIASAQFDITVISSAYAGPDKYICFGTQTATLNASGGTQFHWLDINGDTIPVDQYFSCNPCQNPVVAPDTSTTYILVTELPSGFGCDSVDTVEVVVAPNHEIIMPNDTFVCYGDTIQFMVQMDTLFNNTYQWNNASHLSSDTVMQPFGTPLNAGVNTTYTVTVTSDSGCTKIASFDIASSPLPLPDAGLDTFLCANTGQQAQLGVTGAGFQFNWTSISGDPIVLGTNFSCNGCPNPVASPSITTTYVVEADSFGYCGNTDTVTVFVAPDYEILEMNDTAICYGDTITLNTTYSMALNQTQVWDPNTFISDVNALSPQVAPTNTTAYVITAQSDSFCIKVDTVVVTVSPPFPQNISATVDKNIVCALGDQVQLGVSFGLTTPANCGPSASTGICPGIPDLITVGTPSGQNTTTSYPAPYGNWYRSSKHQFLYTAAELNALGFYGGRINSLAFNIITASGTQNYDNFTIKMKCVPPTQTTLTNQWESGLTTVLTPGSITITTGWNTYQFTQPYDWDGVNNIVVEVCHEMMGSSWTQNAQTQWGSTAPDNRALYYRSDVTPACSYTGTGTVSVNRPIIQLEYCGSADPAGYNYTWSVANGSATISNPNDQSTGALIPSVVLPPPGVPTTFQVVVSDTFGACFDTFNISIDTVNIFTGQIDSAGPFCATDGFNYPLSASNVTPGQNIFWSGPGITNPNTGTFQPSTAGIGIHNVQMIVGLGSPCQRVDDYDIPVITSPAVDIVGPTTICKTQDTVWFGSIDPLFGSNNSGFWTGSALGVTYSDSGAFVPALFAPGTYNLYYIQTTPCPKIDTLQITLQGPFNSNFTTGGANVYCEYDAPVTLVPTNAAGVFTGPGVTGTTFDPAAAGPGVHTITYTGNSSFCNTTTTKTITVNETPQINTSVFDPYLGAWCENNENQVTFDTTAAVGSGITFDWADPTNAGLLLTDASGNLRPSFKPKTLGPGNYQIDLTITKVENGKACENTESIFVQVVPEPSKPLLFSDSPYCEGEELIFVGRTDSANMTINWYGKAFKTNFIQTIDTLNYGTALVTAIDTNMQEFSIYATQSSVLPTGACESKDTVMRYIVYKTPTADFFYNPITGDAPLTVDVTNLSSPRNGVNYTWVWGGATEAGGTTTDWEPADGAIIFYDYCPGCYVSLTADNNGCIDSLYKPVFVDYAETIVVPKVFTPNGDGFNDTWEVFIKGTQEFTGVIRDRWGKKVHEWSDNADVWNGQMNNTGSLLDDGVYFYVITGTWKNGEEFPVQKGTVTLISRSKN